MSEPVFLVALAMAGTTLVLVAGALLFSRSLGKLQTVDTGFRQEGVMTVRVIFQQLNLPPDRYPAFKDELLDRIRGIPHERLRPAARLK